MTDAAAPVLYSFRRCPYAMRARLALAISGTRCELREVRLRDKPPSLLEASSKGTVPVLVLADGTVLEESVDIMRWALARNDPEGWLARADADLIASCDGPFKRSLDRYKYAERDGTDAPAHRAEGAAFLEVLDARLAGRDQLGGQARGFSDAAILPFVRQFVAVDRAWFDAQPLARLRHWLDRHLASDLFGAIMLRVEPWAAGEPMVWFEPSLREPRNPA
ncbi:glutathione S-transferase [Erythrobacter sp. QSSC1-22B]|uniref:glutathione S-transferase n=1 Tax=Erythrobacter sp. QSSC1-22B TaxID=1860125 RepID=UPI0008056302|nr:glutathione S-transferase [Erythrobacter sp. QSSC1-22B]OBX18611.1 glutathione S-transferase [Erythrobacter sp. QSSC1-22B]